jgi:hypothetical protein
MWEFPLIRLAEAKRHRPEQTDRNSRVCAGFSVTARSAAWLVAVAAALALAGCSGARVSVPPVLPVPVVDQLPMVIGLHLTEDLLDYSHKEKIEGGGDWEIELGAAQSAMFDNLLSGMFAQVRVVPNPSAPGGEVAGVLVPNLEEVQFSTPDQTRTDYFEVWVRYRFELYDRDGTLAGEWPLTAYGKANARHYGMNSRQPALQAAALSALRDAMAFFTVQFATVPPVRTWLAAELRGTSS